MAKFKVLFIDNNVELARSWSERLELEGYEVQRCASEGEARAVIRDKLATFSVAVIDLRMRTTMKTGDTSGLDIARLIKGAIPVIILTGSKDMNSVVKAQTLTDGHRLADQVVLKQEGPLRLIEAIESVLVHSVFVAHGHDEGARADVVVCLKALGLQPIILRDTASKGRTIMEAIEGYSNVSFAVILLTPDDLGEAKDVQPPRPRARQNVILEWGFFIGRLGRDRVAALYKQLPDAPLDYPSNYNGVRYLEMDSAGKWRRKLAEELKGAKIPVDTSKVEA